MISPTFNTFPDTLWCAAAIPGDMPRVKNRLGAAPRTWFFHVIPASFRALSLLNKNNQLYSLATSFLSRVFRRRKKIRRSLDSLFNLSASSSWLSSTIPSRMDFSHIEDPWPDGCSKLEASHSDIGKP